MVGFQSISIPHWAIIKSKAEVSSGSDLGDWEGRGPNWPQLDTGLFNLVLVPHSFLITSATSTCHVLTLFSVLQFSVPVAQSAANDCCNLSKFVLFEFDSPGHGEEREQEI